MTTSLLRWALVLGLVLSAAHLQAQTTEEGAPRSAEEDEKKMQGVPLGGIRYGAPLGASAYAGLLLGRKNPTATSGPMYVWLARTPPWSSHVRMKLSWALCVPARLTDDTPRETRAPSSPASAISEGPATPAGFFLPSMRPA